MRFAVREIDVRAGAEADALELLSVSLHHGVVSRPLTDEGQAPSEDTSHYKRCWPGDIVVNRLRAFQGGLGVAHQPGIVSPDYAVLRLGSGHHPPFFHYLMRSHWFVGEITKRLRGLGSPEASQVRTPRINVADIGEITALVPPLDTQRRVAEFLDTEATRISALILKQQDARRLCDERFLAAVVRRVTYGSREGSIGIYGTDYWIGDVPESWVVASLATRYNVMLGKMLNKERSSSPDQRPYLANFNVRWDGFDLDELRTMEFSDAEWDRYGVEPGDLLVCEGGEVGRAAVWTDPTMMVHLQKALHRLRPIRRERDESRFLMYCLMAAARTGVFEAGSNRATIDHLTREKLAEQRFPFPPVEEQRAIVAELDDLSARMRRLEAALDKQIKFLRERRQALITAVVTGQIEA